jgi:hypothetical protein
MEYLSLINLFILGDPIVKDSSTQNDKEMKILCNSLMENQVDDEK